MTDDSINVLLVDDDSVLLRSLSRALSDLGLSIETSTCAAEAKAFLNHYPIEVVVCDQNMPGKSGLEFLEELSQEKPNLIMMLLSGNINGLAMAEGWANEIGVTKIFNKPCDATIIAASIREAVHTQRLMASEQSLAD
ncbi:MAG: DNA-binding NtrC family response regulator [Mariniblastus sp.]|jgi:DNA-binding NtrC family response regulator